MYYKQQENIRKLLKYQNDIVVKLNEKKEKLKKFIGEYNVMKLMKA